MRLLEQLPLLASQQLWALGQPLVWASGQALLLFLLLVRDLR
jgi:hypothetical protein